jgi:hypothetical protein
MQTVAMARFVIVRQPLGLFKLTEFYQLNHKTIISRLEFDRTSRKLLFSNFVLTFLRGFQI